MKTQQITEERFLTARTLFHDGLANIAMEMGQIDTAEVLYKETMKGCLMQVISHLFRGLCQIVSYVQN